MKLSNALIYASSTVISGLMSVVTLPILAWGFSQEDIARLVLLQVAGMLLITFFSLGLEQSYVREYNEYEDKSDLAKSCFTPGFFVLAVVSFVILFFQESVSLLIFGKYDVWLFSFFLFSVFILFSERFFSVFLRMQELVVGYAVTRVLPKLFLLGLALIAFFHETLANLNFLIVAQVISWFSAVFIMALSLRKTPFAFVSAKVNADKVKSLLHFGIPLMVSGFAFWGLTYLDRIMLSSLATLPDVAIYSVAMSFAGAAVMVQQIFSIIWIPVLYKWVANDIIKDKISSVSELVQFLSFAVIALGGAFAWLAPMLLPQEYSKIETIMVFCLMPPLFMLMSEVGGVGINIAKKTKVLPFITFSALVINFVLNVVLIPTFGAKGAALATAVSVFIYLGMKSEVSSYIWFPLARRKQYLITVITFTIACAQAFDGEPVFEFLYSVIWGAWLVLIVLLYKKAFQHILPMLKNEVSA